LQLNFMFEFVKQAGISNNFLNNLYSPGFGLPFTGGNVSSSVLDRWQNLGDNSNIQRFTQSILNYTGYSNAYNSSFAYTDDPSFMRLKTFSLSYSVPSKYIQESGISAITLFVHGQNLWTWTKYKGLDPQNPSGSLLPSLKEITCGVNFKF